MSWLDYAIKRPVRNYTNARRSRTDGVVLHVTAAPNARSQYSWFNNPSSLASSHFHVDYDGVIEQYIDTDLISWAQRAGDQRLLSIETQGDGSGQWTEKQLVSLARLLVDLSRMYGFPLRLMGSSAARERGVGYHAQGVPGSLVQKLRGVSQTGGELWSKATGKICPGPDRIKQIPALIARAAGGSAPAPAPAPQPESQMNTSTSVGCVDRNVVGVQGLQNRLKTLGFYRRDCDGVDGDYTKQAILDYQKAQLYHPNLASDAYWGEWEEKHYQWTHALQGALNGWKTASRMGEVATDGSYGPYTAQLVLQTQRDNLNGAYLDAVRAVYGPQYSADADGVPGQAFCHMLGLPTHPAI